MSGPLAWLLLAAVVAGLGWAGYLLVRRFQDYMARANARFAAVVAERDEEEKQLNALPAEEVYARAEDIMTRYSERHEWDSPIPPEIDTLLAQLDPGLQGLLRRYRLVNFNCGDDMDTEMSAKFLTDSSGSPEGHMTIARFGDSSVICVRPGDPAVYEAINRTIRDNWVSVAHYIVMIHDEEY
jgi:hypothetical protein